MQEVSICQIIFIIIHLIVHRQMYSMFCMLHYMEESVKSYTMEQSKVAERILRCH